MDVVGRIGSLPERKKGRGYAKGDPPLEFQAALPVGGEDKDRAINIRKICEELNKKYPSAGVENIVTMPDVIRLCDVERAEPSKILLGLCNEKVEPLYLDPREDFSAVISGESRAGKTNMMTAVARQFKGLRNAKTVSFSVDKNSALKAVSDEYYSDAASFLSYAEGVTAEFSARKQGGEKFPVAVFVDDVEKCFATAGGDISLIKACFEFLAMVCKGGKMESLNLYLFMSVHKNELPVINTGGIIPYIIENSLCILLGGYFSGYEQGCENLSNEEKSIVLGKYEGYMLKDRAAVRFKSVYSE
jgi:hypothetical protein